jgi:hypothetical protein
MEFGPTDLKITEQAILISQILSCYEIYIYLDISLKCIDPNHSIAEPNYKYGVVNNQNRK